MTALLSCYPCFSTIMYAINLLLYLKMIFSLRVCAERSDYLVKQVKVSCLTEVIGNEKESSFGRQVLMEMMIEQNKE